MAIGNTTAAEPGAADGDQLSKMIKELGELIDQERDGEAVALAEAMVEAYPLAFCAWSCYLSAVYGAFKGTGFRDLGPEPGADAVESYFRNRYAPVERAVRRVAELADAEGPLEAEEAVEWLKTLEEDASSLGEYAQQLMADADKELNRQREIEEAVARYEQAAQKANDSRGISPLVFKRKHLVNEAELAKAKVDRLLSEYGSPDGTLGPRCLEFATKASLVRQSARTMRDILRIRGMLR